MALDYTNGAAMMMQLGGYQFGLTTAAYQTLQRATAWGWAEIERFGQIPALQFVGPEGETITLEGVIYPEYRGGGGQIDSMRATAARGEPLALVSGDGRGFGQWVIKSIKEKQSVFASAGAPRRQEFSVELRFYGAAEGGGLLSAVSAVTAAGVAVPPGAVGAVAQAKGLAQSIADGAKSLAASATNAVAQVQTAVAPFVSVAKDAAGAAVRVVGVASQMQATANQVLSVLGRRPISINAIASAQRLANRANSQVVQVDSAVVLLRQSTATLEGMTGKAADQAARATRGALLIAERTSAMVRQSAAEANKIKAD